MTPTDWLSLWALGRARGLSDEEFWALPPRRWMALREQWERDEERADRRAALIATIMANAYRDPRSPPIRMEDFLPRRKAVRKREMSADEMLERVRALNKAFGGKG